MDTDLFFAVDPGPALSACDRCTVRPECLDDALTTGDRYGVRGGLDLCGDRGSLLPAARLAELRDQVIV